MREMLFAQEIFLRYWYLFHKRSTKCSCSIPLNTFKHLVVYYLRHTQVNTHVFIILLGWGSLPRRVLRFSDCESLDLPAAFSGSTQSLGQPMICSHMQCGCSLLSDIEASKLQSQCEASEGLEWHLQRLVERCELKIKSAVRLKSGRPCRGRVLTVES